MAETLSVAAAQARLQAFATAGGHHVLHAVVAEHEAAVHLVGGAVRDIALGRTVGDLDFVTSTGASTLARRLADRLGASLVTLDAARGIFRVVVGGEHIDICDLQAPSLEGDLRARDLTINAVALDARALGAGNAVVVDPLGGLDDLCGGLLRCPSAEVLDADPLRLVRVVRFASVLGFAIAPETWREIAPRADLLSHVSPERVRDELFTVLGSPRSEEGVSLLTEAGLLRVILPEIGAHANVTRDGPSSRAVDARALHALRAIDAGAVATARAMIADDGGELVDLLVRSCGGERRSVLALMRFAILLRHLGGPDARCAPSSPPGHRTSSAAAAERACERLRLSTLEKRLVASMLAHRHEPGEMQDAGARTPSAARRWFKHAHPAGPEALILALAESEAETADAPSCTASVGDCVAWLLQWRFGGGPARCVPLLDGGRIQSILSLGRGPHIGAWLEDLADAQADGVVTSEAEAVAWVRSRADQAAGHTPS
ncbi:MAG: CCA tRNA nucleotidyltransferase [Proteobacteria bacterium]|nr:CCA tRNA nucleotidyltransferase [Pseudomonadota bacterium]